MFIIGYFRTRYVQLANDIYIMLHFALAYLLPFSQNSIFKPKFSYFDFLESSVVISCVDTQITLFWGTWYTSTWRALHTSVWSWGKTVVLWHGLSWWQDL